METVDLEKWQILSPVGSYVVTINYLNIEVAQHLYEILNLPTISRGFSEPKIEGNKVTVTCKCWSTVKTLEDLARRAKLDIYKRKFEKI